MKQVKCKSGIMGWQGKLRNVYANFQEFSSYCNIYNVHGRLGYKSAETAWNKNPIIQGSTLPSDLRKI